MAMSYARITRTQPDTRGRALAFMMNRETCGTSPGWQDGAQRNGSRQTTANYRKGVWKPVDGGVRETAATFADGGKTWKPWFDLAFPPHKP